MIVWLTALTVALFALVCWLVVVWVTTGDTDRVVTNLQWKLQNYPNCVSALENIAKDNKAALEALATACGYTLRKVAKEERWVADKYYMVPLDVHFNPKFKSAITPTTDKKRKKGRQ